MGIYDEKVVEISFVFGDGSITSVTYSNQAQSWEQSGRHHIKPDTLDAIWSALKAANQRGAID